MLRTHDEEREKRSNFPASLKTAQILFKHPVYVDRSIGPSMCATGHVYSRIE